ncbi:hypothetical protein GGI12_000374 [Dipsacomyces acuminosporus]|nr:hypothetical protein GGI12_000374 [Dipsacomyces acuminosporus]
MYFVVRSLETKLCSRILEQVTSSVNTKMGELVAQIGAKMSASQDRTHEDLNKIVASINGLKADMQQLQGVVSSSESRSQLAPMSIGSTPLPQPLAYASSFDMPLLLPLQPPPAPGRDTASPDQAPEMAATGANIGGGVAGSLCITVNHSIAEHRTSSKGRFSIAEAMRCVDRQHPYRLEEGWPVALAKSKRQKRPE